MEAIMSSALSATTIPHQRRKRALAAAAATVGNALQFYDFFLYATAAVLVLNRDFFPSANATLSMTGALAGYAVGFVSRPLGGIVFGYLGDRFGRKTAMTWTLGLMGCATFGIGILPTYNQVGLLAPILLISLRLVQGFATGGEWGNGILMATENAPPEKRGLYGAWSQAGTGFGFVLASGMFFLVRQYGEHAFLSWGWRIPFLASIFVVFVGYIIRWYVGESEEFLGVNHCNSENPIRDVLHSQRTVMFIAAGVILAEICTPLLTTTFALAYGGLIGTSSETMLAGVTISMAVDMCVMIFFGYLSDKIGRTKVYGFGIIAVAAMIHPFFMAVGSPNRFVVIAAFVVINGICHAAMVATQPAVLTELFPPHLRSSGLALSQSVIAVVVGFLPLVATTLFYRTGAIQSVSCLMIFISLTSFASLLLARGLAKSLNQKAF